MKIAVKELMTKAPHSIGLAQSVQQAHDMMREYNLRHLPVLKGGKLDGIVTDRDVKLASNFDGVSDLKIEDIMTQDPYTVSPETQVSEVVRHLAEDKLGCAIVLEDNKVVGIFTVTDALTYLADKLDA